MNIDEAILQINYAAEKAHRKYITLGFGQMMLYLEKAEQATDFVAANYPKNSSGFPLIEAEAKATNKSPKLVADNILLRRAEWITIAAKIESIRFAGFTLLKTSKSIEKDALKCIADLVALCNHSAGE